MNAELKQNLPTLYLSFDRNSMSIECSGIHRSLGVHYSRVKSLTLDDWEKPVLKLLLELGNDTINSIYVHLPPTTHTPATPTSNRWGSINRC